eukprot:1177806-Rhodomonas_salina.1
MVGGQSRHRDPMSPPLLNPPPSRETGPRISPHSQTEQQNSIQYSPPKRGRTPGSLKPQSPPSTHRLNSSGRIVEAELIAVDDHSTVSAEFVQGEDLFGQGRSIPFFETQGQSLSPPERHWHPAAVPQGFSEPRRSRNDSGRLEQMRQLNRRPNNVQNKRGQQGHSPTPYYRPVNQRPGGVSPDRLFRSGSTPSPPSQRRSPANLTPSPPRQHHVAPYRVGSGVLGGMPADRLTPPRTGSTPQRAVSMPVPISPATAPMPQR